MNSAEKPGFCKEQPTAVDEAVKSNAAIETLPREMMLHIFSYIGTDTLMNTLPQVCKEWAILSRDPSLYRKGTFYGNVSAYDIFKFLRSAPWLESIELIDLPNLDFILYELIRHPNRLRSLTLKTGMSYTEWDISTTLTLLEGCLNMHTLILDGLFRLGPAFYEHLGNRWKNLKVLHLITVQDVDHTVILSFARSCPPVLEEFVYTVELPYRTNNRAILIEMISALATRLHRTLRVFHINGYKWAPEDLDSLKQCCQLREFVVSAILPGKLEIFATWQSLRHLEITVCHSTESDWIRMCSTKAWQNLEVFKTCGHGLTDRVAALIGTNFKNLRKLSFPLVQGKEFSTVGLLSIMKGCTQLKELALLEPMMPRRYEPFRLLPRYLPGLQKLSISVFGVSRIVEFLKVEMPNLLVVTYNFPY